MKNLYAKCEVPIFIRYGNTKGNAKYIRRETRVTLYHVSNVSTLQHSL